MIEAYIDHTLLRADAYTQDFIRLSNEALKYNFRAVCVPPIWVGLSREILGNSPISLASVIGFPLGNGGEFLKVQESLFCVQNGANEIDMVLNIGALKAGDYAGVTREIRAVKKAIGTTILKVILETALLNKDEIATGSKIILDSGADFVKTSTGFSHRGASLEDILTIRSAIGAQIAIKASGKIRSFEEAKSFLDMGVARIGTSNGVAILQEEKSK